MRFFEPPLVIKKQILPSFNNALTIHCKRSSAVVCYVCYVLKIEFSGMYALSLYFSEKLIHLLQMKMMQHATFDTRHLPPTVGSMCSRSYLHPWQSLGKSQGFQVWIEWQHYRIRWQELSMKIMVDMIVIVRIILYHSHDDIEQSRCKRTITI